MVERRIAVSMSCGLETPSSRLFGHGKLTATGRDVNATALTHATGDAARAQNRLKSQGRLRLTGGSAIAGSWIEWDQVDLRGDAVDQLDQLLCLICRIVDSLDQ